MWSSADDSDDPVLPANKPSKRVSTTTPREPQKGNYGEVRFGSASVITKPSPSQQRYGRSFGLALSDDSVDSDSSSGSDVTQSSLGACAAGFPKPKPRSSLGGSKLGPTGKVSPSAKPGRGIGNAAASEFLAQPGRGPTTAQLTRGRQDAPSTTKSPLERASFGPSGRVDQRARRTSSSREEHRLEDVSAEEGRRKVSTSGSSKRAPGNLREDENLKGPRRVPEPSTYGRASEEPTGSSERHHKHRPAVTSNLDRKMEYFRRKEKLKLSDTLHPNRPLTREEELGLQQVLGGLHLSDYNLAPTPVRRDRPVDEKRPKRNKDGAALRHVGMLPPPPPPTRNSPDIPPPIRNRDDGPPLRRNNPDIPPPRRNRDDVPPPRRNNPDIPPPRRNIPDIPPPRRNIPDIPPPRRNQDGAAREGNEDGGIGGIGPGHPQGAEGQGREQANRQGNRPHQPGGRRPQEEGNRQGNRRHHPDGGRPQEEGNRQWNRPQPDGLRPLEANLSFARLRGLKGKDPAEVVAALSYSKEGLVRLLKNEQKLSTDRNMMQLLLSGLAKASLCQSMRTQRDEILNLVRSSEFLSRHLGTFLTVGSVTGQGAELAASVGESADLLTALVTIFPSHLHDVMGATAFLELAQRTAKTRGIQLPADVLQKVEDLRVATDAAVEGLQRRQTRAARGRGGVVEVVDEDALTPPDDFRQVSVFPTREDLNKDDLPFLRKNKVVGGYADVDHYLDVQFRLLREDFVYPLREGIANYLTMLAAPHGGKRLTDIRVYHDVHILSSVCLSSGLGHRLTFDMAGLKRVRWEISKRLIYGSLVCLSADNFQTLFFATVTNREPAGLREGIIDVIFEHDLEEVSAIAPETSFTMAETTAFFEAYRHVLSGLQAVLPDQLPFSDHIVHCVKDVKEPRYLTRTPKTYDLRPLVDNSVTLREDQRLVQQGREVAYAFSRESQPAGSVPALHPEDWPHPELLGLDTSQYEALHQALTKEFSVIQGPPGTGKTYTGLKIAKALLHNRRVWDPDLHSCMLVVCYTNHALDQFLEGIVSFFKGRVVRVGGRSKSEVLKDFTLNEQRWKMRSSRDDVDRDFKEITRLRFQGHEAMEVLKKEVDEMGLKMEAAKREILHEDMLRPYMRDADYERLLDARPYLQGLHWQQAGHKKNQDVYCMPEWLGIGAVLQNTHVTPDDLWRLDHELGQDEPDIEGEIQAAERQNRLDTEDFGGDQNGRQKKERERKTHLSQVRSSYLAIDVSGLDKGQGDQHGGGFQIPKEQWRKLKRKLRRNVEHGDRMSRQEEQQVRDIWTLPVNQRWRLYRRWTHGLAEAVKDVMAGKEHQYDQLARGHRETLLQEDKHILKNATVIAMTTTGAAKYQAILQEVKPKVIVVEEAAEVLEGHVITTLNADCEHLILIGDHKQLRPNPNVFALARKYNLELSLFERMINNGLRCVTLGWQHRMRPEIAALVKPIYPALQNHPSVDDYEDIMGVSSNVFFIDHSQLEAHDEETKSHSNEYEALYAMRLCRYLLKQGYAPDRITVLTTYSGQLYQLRKLMPQTPQRQKDRDEKDGNEKQGPRLEFDGVRVTVVDNFQGEESDIVILSLVRSNPDAKIGFLNIENRVCVALSRAKMGLFVIGNFDNMNAESRLWQTITADLRKEGKVGEALTLECQNHPKDAGLVIRTPDDFDRAPEGGCMKPCTARLDCGHKCERLCHPYDKDHEEYLCTKRCERKMDCELGHPCKKLCHQDCGDCMVPRNKVVAKCGHTQRMACSQDPKTFLCGEPCEKMLVCGHKCGDECGQRHRCYETVQHRWPCGHEGEVRCQDRETAPCPAPCDVVLECEHKCSGTCSRCHGGRLHQRCKDTCTKILVCGHECKENCSNCPPCLSRCENSCVHSSCTKRCGLPCTPCMEPCHWQCPHHRCNKLCSEACERPPCDEPCPYLLACNHPCIGLCGEPCPKLCRVCNAEEVTAILFGTEDEPDARFVELQDCRHVIEVSGLDQWMQTATDSHEDSVQLKACPLCKTAIRTNLRYGAQIKTQLRDIETIKKKIAGDERLKSQTLRDVETNLKTETDVIYGSMKQEILKDGDKQTIGGLVAMINQMKLLDETKKLEAAQTKKRIRSTNLSEAVDKFETWIRSPRLVFSQQEAGDAETEVTRLKHWLSLLHFKDLSVIRGEKLPAKVADPMSHLLRGMKMGRVYTEEIQRTTRAVLKLLEDLLPDSGLGVSDKERAEIVQAMGLTQGHWFKCPKGHIYAIGDCGGATEESRCPECRSQIGGSGHRLRDDNALASEMDGARHAAWSEQQNLENFRLEDLL